MSTVCPFYSVTRVELSELQICITLMRIRSSFHFNADPYPAFHLNADPDPAFNFNVDPDPAFHFNVDPDPAFHFNAYPDQGSAICISSK
jgi:hypothetical protein